MAVEVTEVALLTSGTPRPGRRRQPLVLAAVQFSVQFMGPSGQAKPATHGQSTHHTVFVEAVAPVGATERSASMPDQFVVPLLDSTAVAGEQRM